MKVYIKKATIIDHSSSFHKAKKDLLIEDGSIVEIGDSINGVDADQIIDSKDLHVSQSWVDLKANFCDPGNEHKEDLITGISVAEAGGFGHVFVAADNDPVTDNKAQVKYITNFNHNATTQLHAIGSITNGMKTEQLSEMFDMYQNGVRIFSDATNFLSAGIMHRALLYAQNFDGLVVSFPQNSSIMGEGQVNEGMASVKTGLKAIPAVGETIQVQRDLSLLSYTGGRMHFSGISTSKSVVLIKEAKSNGLNVTCDVHLNHLLYSENDVLGFDTNHKVLPPYRSESDQVALWDGLATGVIDCIVSNHQPQNIEEKDVEFDNASFGNITLQTFYGALSTHFEKHHEMIVEKISNAPRKLLGMEAPSIEVGAKVDLTLFDPTLEWEFNSTTNYSKSINSPLWNSKITGAAIAILKEGQLKLNQSI
jgi:dihydroorotase